MQKKQTANGCVMLSNSVSIQVNKNFGKADQGLNKKSAQMLNIINLDCHTRPMTNASLLLIGLVRNDNFLE